MVALEGRHRERRRALALSSAAMVVSTSMMFTVAVLAPFLIDDGVIGVTSLAWIAACYYFSASSASSVAGRLADALGGRLTIVVLCGANGASLAALAASRNTATMAVAAVAGGVAMSLSNPATNRVIIANFPPGERGAALGWKQAGVPVSGVLAGLLLPTLANALGWRLALVCTLVAPTLVGLLALVVLPEDRTKIDRLGPSARVRIGSLAPYGLLMGLVAGAMNAYLVVFCVHAGLSAASAGLVASMFSASAAVTRVVCAVLSERRVPPRGLMAALGVASFLFVASLPHVPVGWPIWFVGAACGGAVLGWQAVAQLTILGAVPPEAAGTGSAALMRSFFAGLFLGPLLFAGVLHLSGTFSAAFAALGGAAGIAAVVLVVRAPTVRAERRSRAVAFRQA